MLPQVSLPIAVVIVKFGTKPTKEVMKVNL